MPLPGDRVLEPARSRPSFIAPARGAERRSRLLSWLAGWRRAASGRSGGGLASEDEGMAGGREAASRLGAPKPRRRAPCRPITTMFRVAGAPDPASAVAPAPGLEPAMTKDTLASGSVSDRNLEPSVGRGMEKEKGRSPTRPGLQLAGGERRRRRRLRPCPGARARPVALRFAPAPGLEPGTRRLTAACSTD